MGTTPSSLLDLIARGGSLVGYNEAQQSQANTALTRAQVPQVQAQTAREQELARTQAQQTRAAELANQQTLLSLKDNGIIRDAMTGTVRKPGEGNSDYLQRIVDAAKADPRRISAGGYMGLNKDIGGILETHSKLNAADIAQHEAAVKATEGPITALKDALDNDPTGVSAVWAKVQPTIEKYEPGLLPSAPPSDPQELARAINTAAMGHHVSQNLLGLKKTGAETARDLAAAAKDQTDANLNKAKTPGAQAESDKQQLITAAMQRAQSAAQTGQHPIDAILDPKTDAPANASYKAAYDTAMANGGPEAATHIASAAAAHSAQIAMASNPQVRAGEVAKAVAVEQATGPLKVQHAIDLETATNPLKLQQARAQAVATASGREALKLDQDYVKSASATEEIGKVLDLADSGNKAAGAALSTVGAISINAVNGLKRLTQQEVAGLGGASAGDAYDRVVGFFKGATEGQKIPENIRADIRNLHQSIGENAYHAYTTGLDALSKRSGTSYQPTVAAPNIRKGASAGHTVGEVVTVNGGKKIKITAMHPDGSFDGDEVVK